MHFHLSIEEYLHSLISLINELVPPPSPPPPLVRVLIPVPPSGKLRDHGELLAPAGDLAVRQGVEHGV